MIASSMGCCGKQYGDFWTDAAAIATQPLTLVGNIIAGQQQAGIAGAQAQAQAQAAAAQSKASIVKVAVIGGMAVFGLFALAVVFKRR